MSDQRINLARLTNRIDRVRRQVMSNDEANDHVDDVLALVEAAEALRHATAFKDADALRRALAAIERFDYGDSA